MEYLTTAEARDEGVLLEVNRRLLHPRGLALEATLATDDDGGAVFHPVFLTAQGLDRVREVAAFARENGLAWPGNWFDDLDNLLDIAAASPGAGVLKVQDHRGDPEGVYYGDLDAEDAAKAARFDGLLYQAGRLGARLRRLGFNVQPLPADDTLAA